ncbi:hypothetical protein Droror1_Dr00016359, partial [Drosera rotundifolia]
MCNVNNLITTNPHEHITEEKAAIILIYDVEAIVDEVAAVVATICIVSFVITTIIPQIDAIIDNNPN